MAKKKARNTGSKVAKKRNPNIVEAGKKTRFKKGYDPRRNLKGRPKAFDQWRALAQDIAEQVATDYKGKPVMWNGQEITFAEHVLLTWLADPKYLEKFVEAAFGKVPDKLELQNDGQIRLLVEYVNKENKNDA